MEEKVSMTIGKDTLTVNIHSYNTTGEGKRRKRNERPNAKAVYIEYFRAAHRWTESQVPMGLPDGPLSLVLLNRLMNSFPEII